MASHRSTGLTDVRTRRILLEEVVFTVQDQRDWVVAPVRGGGLDGVVGGEGRRKWRLVAVGSVRGRKEEFSSE